MTLTNSLATTEVDTTAKDEHITKGHEQAAVIYAIGPDVRLPHSDVDKPEEALDNLASEDIEEHMTRQSSVVLQQRCMMVDTSDCCR